LSRYVSGSRIEGTAGGDSAVRRELHALYHGAIWPAVSKLAIKSPASHESALSPLRALYVVKLSPLRTVQ